MSNIFEALQRSESERTGVDLCGLSAAIQLLEIAEQDATAKDIAAVPESAEQCENINKPQVAILTEPPLLPPTPPGPSILAAETSPNDESLDQLPPFPSLRVVVPPQSRLVSIADPHSLAAEKFRFLGVRLRHLQQGRQLKKLLITSTIPQEGKSTTAANLACTLARKKNQKTLLLEGDLRRPALTQLFALGNKPGISEWLMGECGPSECIYQLEGAGLWMLPAGTTPSNPLELMQSGRLSPLMDQLNSWFDWVVIDSPPILPLADTSIWMRLADGVLLIARQGITERKQLKCGLEAIEPTKLLGTVLNCSASSAHSDYYYQYMSAGGSPRNRRD